MPVTREEQIGDCRLILGDCREVLPTIGKVDAVITDPPFFTPAAHYQSRIEYQRSWADLSILTTWWDVISDGLVKVAGHSYCLVFCGSDSYAAFYPIMFSKWRRSVCLVWNKGRVGLGRPWRRQHELIIAAIGSDAYEPDDGMLRGDVLDFSATLSRDREHPVEKPWEMLAALVKATTPPGGVVCDPFMGSATCAEAAIRTGRRFIGIEMEPRYYDIARRRVEAAYRQGDLLTSLPAAPAPKPEQASLLLESA